MTILNRAAIYCSGTAALCSLGLGVIGFCEGQWFMGAANAMNACGFVVLTALTVKRPWL